MPQTLGRFKANPPSTISSFEAADRAALRMHAIGPHLVASGVVAIGDDAELFTRRLLRQLPPDDSAPAPEAR